CLDGLRHLAADVPRLEVCHDEEVVNRQLGLARSLEPLLSVFHRPLTAARGGPSNTIAPSGSTRGRGDRAADSGSAQVNPVRAKCLGEKVLGNPARGRPRAPRISLRSLETARISLISNPGAWEPAFHSRAKANRVAGSAQRE